jgi:hypothetical protein
MEYLAVYVLVVVVIFLVHCAILRFVIGTDRIMHYQREQIRLLEKLLERNGGTPEPTRDDYVDLVKAKQRAKLYPAG